MESTALTSTERGFTLVEMIVVLAIIGVLSTILIVGQSSFNKGTLLTETAFTIALSLREMQSFGLSSRAFSSSLNAGYGVHFGDSTTYYNTFADIYPGTPGSVYIGSNPVNPSCPGHTTSGKPDSRPGNCVYDSSVEKIQQYNLSQGFKISRMCYYTLSLPICVNAPFTRTIDILYERPNNQAVMSTTAFGFSTLISKAVIELTSPQSTVRCVIVNQLGEVYVDASANCP